MKYSLFAIALTLTVSSVDGRVYRVRNRKGESIQEAIDDASPGKSMLVLFYLCMQVLSIKALRLDCFI